jgi:hypothetical protein
MYKALYLSPMIPSYNIPETLSFFTNVLSFSAVMVAYGYAIARKDNLSVHILNAGTDIGEMEFYLEIDDVDGLWESIKDKLTGIKIREPFDREYGMREMHIIIPHTKPLLFIGQAL